MNTPGDDYDLPERADKVPKPAERGDDESADADVSEIRESIRRTREDMSDTIDELQERLSPSHMKQQLKERAMEVGNDLRVATIGKVEDMAERIGDTVYVTRRSIVETVSANPVPSALVGVGLAWLWMNRRRDHGRTHSRRDDGGDWRRAESSDWRRGESSEWRTAERSNWSRGEGSMPDSGDGSRSTMSNVVEKVGETAGNLADKAKQTVSGLISQTSERVDYVSSRAQDQARRVEESVSAAIQQSPLAVGAVALAVGTAIGLVIPQTRKENEWMGEARDTLVDKAQSVASEAIDKAQHVAEKVADEMSSPNASMEQSAPGA